MREEVSKLIDTSVEDMKSSLECAKENGQLQINLLKEALRYAIRFGEIARQKILKRYIKIAEERARHAVPLQKTLEESEQ